MDSYSIPLFLSFTSFPVSDIIHNMKNPSLEILYEDNYIIVCKKPSGVATESANIRNIDMVSLVKAHLSKNSSSKYLGVVHRLDQPVLGILVFTKDPESAAILSKQVQTTYMVKIYTATVEGNISDVKINPPAVSENGNGTILLTNYLIKDVKNNMAIVSDKKSGKESKLIYEKLSYNPDNNTSTLRIKLLSGRFHQIRAQLSSIGHPILYDVKYGANHVNDNHEGIALCANELHFKHPHNGKNMDFSL